MRRFRDSDEIYKMLRFTYLFSYQVRPHIKMRAICSYLKAHVSKDISRLIRLSFVSNIPTGCTCTNHCFLLLERIAITGNNSVLHIVHDLSTLF